MWEVVRQNQIKTVTLMLGLGIILIGLGYWLSHGVIGIYIALAIWIIHLLCSYFMGDSLFLTKNRAEQVMHPSFSPTYWNVVEEMTIASGMAKMPKIYMIDEPAPNAFAVGRDPEHASVAVTSGLLKLCNRDELQGVVAHELAHINNRDSLYMIMAASMVSIISYMLDMLRYQRSPFSRTYNSGGHNTPASFVLLIIPALLVSVLTSVMYYGISRKREYLADATGAIYTRYPEGLASALEKISEYKYPVVSADTASAPLYIINPLKSNITGLFSTHPPTESRVKILRSMAGQITEQSGEVDFSMYNQAFQSIHQTQENLIPKSALYKSPETRPVIQKTKTNQPINHLGTENSSTTYTQRHREVTDSLWKMNNYYFVDCWCGNKLKIPPAYFNQEISCPHCHKKYTIEA